MRIESQDQQHDSENLQKKFTDFKRHIPFAEMQNHAT